MRVQGFVGAVAQAGYMVQAWLAEFIISYRHWFSTKGRPWPP